MEEVLASVQSPESTPLRNGADGGSESTVPLRPISDLVNEIEVRVKKSYDQMISAAMLLRELRRRVEAGEEGEVKWSAWAAKNIKLSPSRRYQLQAIAAAEDPAAELERQRDLGRIRGRDFRDKERQQERALEPERQKLLKWVKIASIENVKAVLEHLRLLNPATEAALGDEHPSDNAPGASTSSSVAHNHDGAPLQ